MPFTIYENVQAQRCQKYSNYLAARHDKTCHLNVNLGPSAVTNPANPSLFFYCAKQLCRRQKFGVNRFFDNRIEELGANVILVLPKLGLLLSIFQLVLGAAQTHADILLTNGYAAFNPGFTSPAWGATLLNSTDPTKGTRQPM